MPARAAKRAKGAAKPVQDHVYRAMRHDETDRAGPPWQSAPQFSQEPEWNHGMALVRKAMEAVRDGCKWQSEFMHFTWSHTQARHWWRRGQLHDMGEGYMVRLSLSALAAWQAEEQSKGGQPAPSQCTPSCRRGDVIDISSHQKLRAFFHGEAVR